jgi:DNA-directed RNA polymerase specialized sigma24 family protein
MSRNFTPDETLIDRLLVDDTEAFEELHRRYCYSLYTYCLGKLNAPEDARRIVRDIFIGIWENRHALPVNFSISLHLYTEVRKAVVECINKKSQEAEAAGFIEQQIIPGFSVMQLQKARQPVKYSADRSNYHSSVAKKGSYEDPWWNPSTLHLKKMQHALRNMLNLF